MHLRHLWLRDFRNYKTAAFSPAPSGLTAVVGGNGAGKTSLLEAVGYLATLDSFRGAPPEALVRSDSDAAVVRAELHSDGREVLVEAELPRVGRQRVLVNRQPLRRARDLLGAVRVSVFAPDDLVLVKGGPGERRRYLDDLLVALHPRHDELRGGVERVLRQRNTLLKQAGGRLAPDDAATLDVWDAKLAELGAALVRARLDLLVRLEPEVAKAYGQLAGGGSNVTATYVPSWPLADGPDLGLAVALAAGRDHDIRRGLSVVGPHRDDVTLAIGGLPTRTHASQAEQRSLAVALRLAGHALVAESTGTPPVLLLDDVFSELDPARGAALLGLLPAGQALLTTASALPAGAEPAVVVRVDDGVLR